jgi:hypothetical protein
VRKFKKLFKYKKPTVLYPDYLLPLRLVKDLVRMMELNRFEGDRDKVEKILNEHELVFGVWQDEGWPWRIGYWPIKGREEFHKVVRAYPIKGLGRYRNYSDDGKPWPVKVWAVGLENLEQAMVIEKAFEND